MIRRGAHAPGARSRSGPNIPESQRHTTRIRLSSLAHAIAAQRAAAEATTVAKIIEALLLEAAERKWARSET